MKRKIILSVIVAVCSLCAVTSYAEFRYGPTAGMTVSNLSFSQDNILTPQSTVGFSAGIFGEKMFPGIGFGVDIALAYEQRGATLDLGRWKLWNSQGYTGDSRLYLHYLSIPVHLRFKYTKLNGLEDYVAPFIYAGPSINFLLAHNGIDCLDYNTAEIGIDIGIGAEIFRNWHISASYNFGVTDALGAKVLTDYNATNQTWSVRVAYLF
ncbi:MAG: PorT family protein [Paramuribaculum sp.]|nr:PorT family protein [Paramuribaculum sp.]